MKPQLRFCNIASFDISCFYHLITIVLPTMSIYQTPQPHGFTPEELAQSKALEIYISVAFVTVIATVGVVLRFMSRRKSDTALSYDDYTIALALVGTYQPYIEIGFFY